ncbi:unnamed protein product, partial [Heligmosomoides polygyrus]|uniref:NB-ARC domain-containing protein n=1 Tax=Heligmosomoides polygyrus TaxID=6339 RepID=A0A183FZS6_HELPZ
MTTHGEDYDMKDYSDDEGVENRSVKSVSSSKKFPDMMLAGELEDLKRILRDIPEVVKKHMAEHKISQRYKERHAKVVKVVRETKASHEAPLRSGTEAGQRSDDKKESKLLDWSVLRAQMETMCGDRTDISLGEKIKLHREGATCYDASALKDVLKMAYDKCIDWTEFITNTQKIRQHGSIQGHHFESSYDEALRAVRDEVMQDAIRSRPQKEGPVGFMAGEGASALEKDGQRGDVLTKMVSSFDRMLELLEEWSSFRTWVIVWPLDSKMDEDKTKRLLKLARGHLQSGGKLVTVWPPINEKNAPKWK